MTALIRWLVKHWLPGWHLLSLDEWAKMVGVPGNSPGAGYHKRRASIVRNPTRKPKPVAVFDDGELVWKEEKNDTRNTSS
jgi:hypothetical protein